MDGWGFIHAKLDLKILILYVLTRLPAPMDPEALAELVLIDGGVGYFDYKQCLAELIDGGVGYFDYKQCLAELVDGAQVEQTQDGCVITAKGSRNAGILSGELPYPVRLKADKATRRAAEEMRRREMILANHETGEGGVTVYLSVSDGLGSIFDLKILAADEEQAKKIERNFKRNAEGYYNRVIEMLSE